MSALVSGLWQHLDDAFGRRRVAPRPGAAPRDLLLSDREVQRFRDDGFLVLAGRCDHGELQSMHTMLSALFETRAGFAEGNQFDMLAPDNEAREPIQPQILRPSLYAPALLHTAHFRRVQAVARQLLGPEARLAFDHSILKRAGTAAATPWHQDGAYQQDPRFHYDQLSFWLPLQDTGQLNGCMRYVPGSNRGPLLPHRPPDGDPRVHALECPREHFDESTALTRPVAAGTCIVHDGLTLHAAMANRSDTDRLVYVLAFIGPPLPLADGLRTTGLETRRTAAMERHLRWRRRGGFVVQFGRWLQRGWRADWLTLRLRLQRYGWL